jgi:heat-inducible transcriptional repressor
MRPVDGLSERDRRVLVALVRCHIATGEPVSSLWLADRGGFDVSSATVRNVLGRLERLGLVRQPHTSAGRVPTDLGYRVYVDHLLETRRPARPAAAVQAFVRRAGTETDLLAGASRALARASHQLGFALAPAGDAATFQHVDFVPLGGGRVLVVVIAGSGRVAQHVVAAPEPVGAAALARAADELNTGCAGRLLGEIGEAIGARLAADPGLAASELGRAFRVARAGFEAIAPERTLCVDGTARLLEELAAEAARTGEAEVVDALEALQALLRLIEAKHRMARLLSACIQAAPLAVVIGREHQAPGLRRFSLVASRFGPDDRAGAVGVIGPMRMPYARAIAAVDGVAAALNRALESPTLEGA